MVHDNYRHVPEIDDTLIGEKLKKGEAISFSPKEMPSEIVLLLGGSASQGIGPVRLRILNVSDWPVSHSGWLAYSDQETKNKYNNDGYTIDPTCRFLVVSEDPDLKHSRGIKGIRPDKPVIIGRESECERFPELNNISVSRRHIKIMCDEDGRLTIVDTSTNGTIVEYYCRPSSQWDDLRNFGEQSAAVDPERRRDVLIFARPTSRGRDGRFGNDLDKRLKVTNESCKDAALAYRLSDREVKAIVEKYATPERWRTEDMHELIREKNELRVELGEYILQKLESSSIALPDRVLRNEQKNINYTGYDYPNVSSREAVALIALSMLDGTFKRTPHDPVEIDEITESVVCGQHRWTAANVLGIGNKYLAKVAGIKKLVKPVG